MKILLVFIDMLGANYLNHGNKDCTKTSMDCLIDRIGGTFYSRCYTPAPDTPRSSACMWSGRYPKANGCNNRLKYPGRFLITADNLWESTEKAGYHCNLYVRPTINRIGLLPYPFEKKVLYEEFNDALEQFDICDNSITFFYLPDLHYMMDVNGYKMKTMSKGTDIVVGCVDKILDQYGINTFDYIMLFSDHGFRINEKPHIIDDDRVRTFMFLHRKGDTNIDYDNQIRTVLDIYPTVMEMIKCDYPNNLDGKSLFGDGHDFVMIEDHNTFSVKLCQTIEHWAVVREDGKHWLECDGKWEHEHAEKDFDEDIFKLTIADKMNNYESNTKLWTAMHIYDNNKIENIKYTDGTPITATFTNRGVFKVFKTFKWLYSGFRHAMRTRK